MAIMANFGFNGEPIFELIFDLNFDPNFDRNLVQLSTQILANFSILVIISIENLEYFGKFLEIRFREFFDILENDTSVTFGFYFSSPKIKIL